MVPLPLTSFALQFWRVWICLLKVTAGKDGRTPAVGPFYSALQSFSFLSLHKAGIFQSQAVSFCPKGACPSQSDYIDGHF